MIFGGLALILELPALEAKRAKAKQVEQQQRPKGASGTTTLVKLDSIKRDKFGRGEADFSFKVVCKSL